MPSVEALIKGYGPDFPPIEELLALEPDEAERLRLEAPSPALGRYFGSVKFMQDITSGRAVGLLRFQIIVDYLFALNDELTKYDGIHKDKKVVSSFSDEDKASIRALITPSDVYRAERMEKFSEHDTAAATDLVKIKIGRLSKYLEEIIEGVHFGNTSEDVMANVFGMIGNKLVYGHFLPVLIDFCDNVMNYVKAYENDGPLVIPAKTHRQAAEPTTLGKKFMTRVEAIVNAIDGGLVEKTEKNGGLVERFKPFSGKLNGAVGNFTTHYAAYPDIDWQDFSKRFVKGHGLHYEYMTDQCVSYVREASILSAVANILTQVIKFTDDFVDMASSPGQLFVKRKKKGQKGSSIMPNKSNAWGMEGGIKMLKEARANLHLYADELQTFPQEGDMGRSYLFRNIGTVLMPAFIALGRISKELNAYVPNPGKIKTFLDEYPGMPGSVIQTVLKRERIEGDAYREIQDISINPDGTYANAEQFRAGLELKTEKLGLKKSTQAELLRSLDPANLIRFAHLMACDSMGYCKNRFETYRKDLEKYASQQNP